MFFNKHNKVKVILDLSATGTRIKCQGLVDAANAFNSLNCQVVLRNMVHVCPSLAKILINTYRNDVKIFINNDTLLSCGGTSIILKTQQLNIYI